MYFFFSKMDPACKARIHEKQGSEAFPSWSELRHIIDSIDDMNKNGVNALLKLIEEPPEKCLFLIVCHNPGRVLDTIRSRCRMLPFNALDESDLQSIVHARMEGSDPNEVAASAFLAQGSAGYALMLCEEGGFDLYREMIEVLETAPQLDVEKLHGLAGRFGAVSYTHLTLPTKA